MNDPNKQPAQTVVSDGFDGLDDGGTSSIIRGSKIKFSNAGEWLDEAGDVITPECELLVIEIAKYTQKWLDGRPAETRPVAPDECFPDVERLNEEAPKTEWREKFGVMRGPWQNTIAVYLFDAKSAKGFTFPTSTAGGFRAVSELKGRVRNARMVQGVGNIYPVVTLSAVHMNTAYGGRQRPQFKVQRFISLGGAVRPLLEQAKLEQPEQKKPPFDDHIPF